MDKIPESSYEHTPGPWEAVDLPHNLVVRTESPNKTRYGASRYAAIGGFDRSDPGQFAESVANARLIAAAPDLLAALSVALIDLKIASDSGDFGTEFEPSIYQVQAAIAKATGRKRARSEK